MWLLQDFPTAQWDEEIHWADGFVIVCSVTDRKSFQLVSTIHRHIANVRSEESPNMVLVANKVDLVHCRIVSQLEVTELAGQLNCLSYEVAASEDIDRVRNIFEDMYRIIKLRHKMEKQRVGTVPMHKERSRLRMALNLFLKDSSAHVHDDAVDVPIRDRTNTM